MAHSMAICRVRLEEDDGSDSAKLRPLSADDKHSIGPELRLKWRREIMKKFCYDANRVGSHRRSVRDWDLVLSRDGRVENIAEQDASTSVSPSSLPSSSPSDLSKRGLVDPEPQAREDRDEDERIYAVEYRAPGFKIATLESEGAKLSYQELFAIGGLLYEVITLHRPFHEYDDLQNGSEEQREQLIASHFEDGRVPEDVWDLPSGQLISLLSCWCPELVKILRQRTEGTWSSRFKKYVQAHPYRFSLQALGATAAAASMVVVPVLGAVGFGALGPAAGSAAATWQASMGIVEAGSLFAWCQSAAMGGAAAATIFTAGASSGAVFVGTSLLQLFDRDEFNNLEIPPAELRELFMTAWKQRPT